jgi:hypothetical protein
MFVWRYEMVTRWTPNDVEGMITMDLEDSNGRGNSPEVLQLP